MTGRGIHDVVMSPITRLTKTQLETRSADLLRGKLQCLKSAPLDIADEHQGVVQRLAAHCGGRPQCEKYPCCRVAGWMIHKLTFYPHLHHNQPACVVGALSPLQPWRTPCGCTWLLSFGCPAITSRLVAVVWLPSGMASGSIKSSSADSQVEWL